MVIFVFLCRHSKALSPATRGPVAVLFLWDVGYPGLPRALHSGRGHSLLHRLKGLHVPPNICQQPLADEAKQETNKNLVSGFLFLRKRHSWNSEERIRMPTSES